VSLVGGSCIFISLHIFFTFKKQFTNMKIYKIRHLWALALMLGVGGCKANDAIVATKCDYSQAQGGSSCKGCETPVCETVTGIELFYTGKGRRHGFEMRYPAIGKDLVLSVCDSTRLKDVTLKMGNYIYIVDYNRKLGCQQIETTSAFILEIHYGDIISIREKK
jgi:hypothetical protein